MPARTFPVNPRLEIYTDEGQAKGQNEKLEPTSTRYQEVERCIQMALIVLESQSGRNSLLDTAKDIITNRRSKNKPTLYTGDFSDLSRWIDVFLRCMRNDFPMTYLAHMKGEAMAVRQANNMKAMSSFSPKHMGYMDVNRYIINNMISARARKDVRTETLFRFQMVISIGHEIVHFLTGFFTGDKADKIGTPPRTAVAGYGTNVRGEAGRFWEQSLLGGQLEMWEDKANQLGILQAGQPYLMDDGQAKSRARVVNYGYIEQFIAGSKSSALPSHSGPSGVNIGTKWTESILGLIANKLSPSANVPHAHRRHKRLNYPRCPQG